MEKGMATHSVFLPGESHGQRNLTGYSLWESKTAERNWSNLAGRQAGFYHPQKLGPQLPSVQGSLIILTVELEKAVAPHPSTVAWKILWTEEPGSLQSMGSLRVRHDWATSLSLFTFMYWRRKWQPTPMFLPGESQGRGSLVGCRLWGCTESYTTEVT